MNIMYTHTLHICVQMCTCACTLTHIFDMCANVHMCMHTHTYIWYYLFTVYCPNVKTWGTFFWGYCFCKEKSCFPVFSPWVKYSNLVLGWGERWISVPLYRVNSYLTSFSHLHYLHLSSWPLLRVFLYKTDFASLSTFCCLCSIIFSPQCRCFIRR